MKQYILFSFLIAVASVLVAQFDRSPISFLALGDSYTIGQSVSENERWPNQLGDSLSVRGKALDTVVIRATTGWTTSNLLSSLTNAPIKHTYNMVSLLIGVNNFFQGKPESLYLEEFPQLLDSALKYCDNDTSGVFVVSIPDYGYTAFGQGNQAMISVQTDRYNFIADSICRIYGISFYNVTPISRRGLNEPGLVASDNLHPSGDQYSLWVSLMLDGESVSQISSVEPQSPVRAYYDLELGWVVVGNTYTEVTLVNAMGQRTEQTHISSGDSIALGKNAFGFYYRLFNDEEEYFYRLGK